MLSNLTLADEYVYSSFDQKAEKDLIRPMLEEPYFKEVRLLLASYVHAHDDDKGEIIEDLMKFIWKGNELFKSFSAFDKFLGMAGKRGHHIHQFEVFLLGVNVFLAIKKEKPDIFTGMKFDNVEAVINTWLLASSAHDFGYPIEDSNKVFEKIGDLYGDFSLASVQNACRSFDLKKIIRESNEYNDLFVIKIDDIDTSSTHSVSKIIYDGLNKSLNATREDLAYLQSYFFNSDSHAYISSALLCKSMVKHLFGDEETCKSHHSWKNEALSLAMGAITLHGLNSKHQEDKKFISMLSYEKNPYAYFLYIFDNLQDWNRTIKKDSSYPYYILKDVVITASNIALCYLVKGEECNSEIVAKAKVFIAEKKENLELLTRPEKSLGITFNVKFIFDCDEPPQVIWFSI